MANQITILTLERRPICSVELTSTITGEIGQVGVLIPKDQHAFREQANQGCCMILQLPGREPYYITIQEIHGSLFRVDGKA